MLPSQRTGAALSLSVQCSQKASTTEGSRQTLIPRTPNPNNSNSNGKMVAVRMTTAPRRVYDPRSSTEETAMPNKQENRAPSTQNKNGSSDDYYDADEATRTSWLIPTDSMYDGKEQFNIIRSRRNSSESITHTSTPVLVAPWKTMVPTIAPEQHCRIQPKEYKQQDQYVQVQANTDSNPQ